MENVVVEMWPVMCFSFCLVCLHFNAELLVQESAAVAFTNFAILSTGENNELFK